MKNLDYAFKTHIGMPDREFGDYFFYRDNLFIVVEGVGGGYLSEIAREEAFRIIPEAFFTGLSENNSPAGALVDALEKANQCILDERRKLGEKIAASISVIYIRKNIMYFSHLGDTRIYSFQGGELNQLTKDHSLIEENLFPEKSLKGRGRVNAITDGLGIHKKPDIKVKKYPLHKMGLIFLTTEGLTSRVSNREILWLTKKTKSPDKLCNGLMNLVDRKGGAETNFTIGIIRFGWFSKGFKNILLIYSLFLILILLFSGVYFLKFHEDETPGEVVGSIPPMNRSPVPNDGQTSEKPKVISQPPSVGGIKEAQPAIVNPVEAPTGKEETAKETGEELFNRIYSFISEWKRAWELTAGINGNGERYISFYSDDFKSSKFDKEKWKRDKEVKGREKDWIRIELSDIKISGPTKDNLMEVRFNQDYRSSNFSVESEKLLVLKKDSSGWKIVAERSK